MLLFNSLFMIISKIEVEKASGDLPEPYIFSLFATIIQLFFLNSLLLFYIIHSS